MYSNKKSTDPRPIIRYFVITDSPFIENTTSQEFTTLKKAEEYRDKLVSKYENAPEWYKKSKAARYGTTYDRFWDILADSFKIYKAITVFKEVIDDREPTLFGEN